MGGDFMSGAVIHKKLNLKREPSTTSDLRAAPAYGFAEAAHYLRIPVNTLRNWVHGWHYDTATGEKRSKPLIQLPQRGVPSLSFFNLVEAHVLDAIRREHCIPMDKVRKALDYVQKHFPSKHPLAEQRFETDGIQLFVSQFGNLISASEAGQLALREVLAGHLRRVEHDSSGLAMRLYPFTRKRTLDEPKIVVIDPRFSFGRPFLAGTGVPTNIIAERYKAGESIDDLADDYGCERPHIEEAVRCELALAA
jgi:uncharacterized protein (DUF433 family)